MTEAGLLGLAGRVDGVSVDKARLLARVRAAADVAANGARRSHAAHGRTARRRRLVDAAHSAGLRVFTWTLRPENRFLVGGVSGAARRGRRSATGAASSSRSSATGVDGIFVDHPDLGVEARRAMRG